MEGCECLVTADEHNTGINTVSWQNSCVISGSPSDGAIHIWDLQAIKKPEQQQQESPTGEEDIKAYRRDYDIYLFHCSKLVHPGVYCAEILPNENGITKLVAYVSQSLRS